MNLPPFPVLPLTPEERILWIDWGERVAAAERERAAKVCEAIGADTPMRLISEGYADAIRKARPCPLCGYQHGHAIGCENNPVDIALAVCRHGIHMDNACGACVPPRGTTAAIRKGNQQEGK